MEFNEHTQVKVNKEKKRNSVLLNILVIKFNFQYT